ncbi:Ppx/GppA phosphatase family protein [Pleomorphovibrio marinus]|uniref:Ppx/GppA phosphatase family protein n=1 Tax=Pleomorphovibrio marinus TaxID=2164132 RepID=UPI000E0A7A4B|nr:Ppx/GppA phosphatase family protein [Pleomorphovibrio marinus]
MKLAAIDIGTNSIHMVIVEARSREQFDILMQEKEMVKLGEGVFASNIINDRAFKAGIETIKRYVQLADQFGVDHIITSATSATREAKNGRDFLDAIIAEAGLSPQLISGKEEARLIFLAVRKAIDLKGQRAMVLDIGGGSTEAVTGDNHKVDYCKSMKLGVLRLLDYVGHQNPLNEDELTRLKEHVRKTAQKVMQGALERGFDRIIGTSGTIRSLGEACLTKQGNPSPESVNAEWVSLEALEKLAKKLCTLNPEDRAKVNGISSNRADAVHLGAVLLVELMQLSGLNGITLSDASLREGMILDYLYRHDGVFESGIGGKHVKEKSCLLLASRYEVDVEEKFHVARLALQIFDQLKDIHGAETEDRQLLYHSCIIYEVGLFVKFQDYHKHSRYLIWNSQLRGFNNEEVLLLGHLARYHRKGGPKKKQKKFRKLIKSQQKRLRLLSGVLRVAVGLDKTKNQWVQHVYCVPETKKITIKVFAEETPDLEIWEAQRFSDVLSKSLKRNIEIVAG